MKLPAANPLVVIMLFSVLVTGCAGPGATGPEDADAQTDPAARTSVSVSGPVNVKEPGMSQGTSVILDGTVASTADDLFKLEYGQGTITVELSDFDRTLGELDLRKGDRVLVSGQVDDDVLGSRTIEATSVTVKRTGTKFYARDIGEAESRPVMQFPAVTAGTVVNGRVSEVRQDSFSIDTDLRRIIVDVSDMPENPLDDEGSRKIEVGDYVSVTGGFYSDVFADRRLEAEGIITIRD